MKLSIRVVLILGILLAGGTAWALHPFYEQNGDCYLLVGDGAKRGVYALNNLSSGVPNLLYDPYDAYGLTASQKWDPIANKSIKELFTFAGTETGLTPLSGMVARRVMTQASSNVTTFTRCRRLPSIDSMAVPIKVPPVGEIIPGEPSTVCSPEPIIHAASFPPMLQPCLVISGFRLESSIMPAMS